MAARPNPLFDTAAPVREPLLERAAQESPLAALARMHHEAAENARLANLLGRALPAAIGLPIFAALAVLGAGGAGVPSTIAWAILIAVASLSIARAYASAINQPFERAVLRAFAQDLNACLLYAGFAWGAGAFLALGSGASAVAILSFAGVPTAGIALMLRDRMPALVFLAPVAALTAFACVLRPFAHGALAAGLVLIVCAAVAAIAIAAARYVAARRESELPHGLTAS
jgi:hypothetical protein